MAAKPTFFNNLKVSFADVPIDATNNDAIPTSAFLEASESLCTLFGTANESTRCSQPSDNYQMSSAQWPLRR